MLLDFDDPDLARLASDRSYDMGFDRAIVKSFRMAIQAIHSAVDERIFAARPGWRYEKLGGDLRGKYSIRLNKQWRLLFRLETRVDGKVVVIISITDYH